MIVTATPEGWRCITQPDHARLAREILSLWRTDGMPEHPRREELLAAVLEHDNGWREADSAPRLLRAEGRPHDFVSYPREGRIEIWRRGIERYRGEQPYVAALILEHAAFLHRDRRGAPEWTELLDDLDAQRPELERDSGVDPETLRSDYRWLHTADLLSLAFCAGWKEPFERWSVRGRCGPDILEVSPFPLAGTTRFSVPCRYLPRGEYRSDPELATALASCRWKRLAFRLRPWPDAERAPRPAGDSREDPPGRA